MVRDFKAFLLRGNVVDLAVGIVSECLSEIPREARKCAFCASVQADAG